MKTIIIYHRDLDGLASALIARKKYPNAEMISVLHGEEDNIIERFRSNRFETVIIVDFSFKDTTMNMIKAARSNELIWIDHHKSAKEKLSDIWDSKEIKGIRSTKKAACELTWDYFYPKEECPYAILLIGDRDTWTWKYKDKTKHFNLYLESYSLNDKEMWDKLTHFMDLNFDEDILEEHMYNILEEGKIISCYKDTLIKRIYENGTIEDHEYRLDSPILKSDISDYVFKKHPGVEITRIKHITQTEDIAIMNMGLYSRGNIDVSKIAMENGGGGHHNASGYNIRLGKQG